MPAGGQGCCQREVVANFIIEANVNCCQLVAKLERHMAIDRIHLRNLIRLILVDQRLRTKLLRQNIRADINRAGGVAGEPRDFYSPFWADAKNHARGRSNLRETTDVRAAASRQRRRLYPALRDGFLSWWEERRRRRNEPFTILEDRILGECELEGLGVIRVENNLAFQIGDDGMRVVYPYFSDEPELTSEVAAMALWVMSRAVPQFRLEDMRILDVIRGVSYSLDEAPLTGSDEMELRNQYASLLERWYELRDEYH